MTRWARAGTRIRDTAGEQRKGRHIWAEPSNSILTANGNQLFNSWAPPAHLSKALSFTKSFLGSNPSSVPFISTPSLPKVDQHLYFLTLLLTLGPFPHISVECLSWIGSHLITSHPIPSCLHSPIPQLEYVPPPLL